MYIYTCKTWFLYLKFIIIFNDEMYNSDRSETVELVDKSVLQKNIVSVCGMYIFMYVYNVLDEKR